MPFELMLALFQLEHRSSSPLDRTNIQAGIHTLLSRDWSHASPIITSTQGQEVANTTIFPSLNKPEQLALW